MTPGKLFEQSFKNSIDVEKQFIYRFRDSATSFAQGEQTRFTPSNICDYLLFDNDSKTMYLLELKTVGTSSLSLNNIRKNQIKELTNASKYNIVCGFVVNFRQKDNATYFLNIKDFNKMMESWDKKSININDIKENNGIEISNEKKISRYKYDITQFINDTKL